jgi:hypothetical protein
MLKQVLKKLRLLRRHYVQPPDLVISAASDSRHASRLVGHAAVSLHELEDHASGGHFEDALLICAEQLFDHRRDPLGVASPGVPLRGLPPWYTICVPVRGQYGRFFGLYCPATGTHS